MKQLTVGSLFSGAGGFDLGFSGAGFKPAWFCEIDPTARAVLNRHWPEVPCYEDITTLDPATIAPVDVLIGGFPCQDVSVAGNRAGLAGDRTGLFWEMARIIEGLSPTWLVLENVPGLLSSDGPNDMGTILWALGERGYGWAYRVLDAQHWGVPQRRRRVFIVGHSGADTRRAAAVLFESEGGGGDSEAGGETGQELAYCLSSGSHRTGSNAPGRHREDDMNLIADPIGGGNHGSGRRTEDDPNLVVDDTVRSHPRPGSNSVGNLAITPVMAAGAHGSNGAGIGRAGDPMFSLDTTGAQAIIANTVQASAGHHGHSSPRGDGSDNLVVAHCLNGSQERLDGTVETLVTSLAENQRGEFRTSDISPALGTGGGKPGSGFSAAWNGSTVRRLMPVECERLQGWPTGWTSAANGQWLKDGPRYRLIGNGVAAPVARWIAERILAVHLA